MFASVQSLIKQLLGEKSVNCLGTGDRLESKKAIIQVPGITSGSLWALTH